jgi:hypothetical protein
LDLYVDHHQSLPNEIYHFVDAAVRIESFEGSKAKTSADLVSDYQGIFTYIKPLRVNSLSGPAASLDFNKSNLAFKCRRKQFLIESMHLPPELGSDSSRQQGATLGGGAASGRASSSAGKAGSSNMDF